MRTRRLVATTLISAVLLTQSACGTILHPERKGQAQTNRLDASVVILDGIGLFFFFIPGLIAFAVDFSNNTIYLPDGESASAGEGSLGRAVTLDEALDEATIESVIERELAVADVIDDARLEVRRGDSRP